MQQVSSACRSPNEEDLQRIKLALRTDYLVSYRFTQSTGLKSVPFKYILQAREVLLSSNYNPMSLGLFKVDIQDIIELIISDRGETMETLPLALKSPSQYYENAKVCKRCYQVYMLFALPHKPQPVEPKFEKTIDVNSLDYLLEDIQDLKFSMKYGESREKFAENSKYLKEEKSKDNSGIFKSRRTTLDAVKLEEIGNAKLTEEIFPDARSLKGQRKGAKVSFKSYLKRLKVDFIKKK